MMFVSTVTVDGDPITINMSQVKYLIEQEYGTLVNFGFGDAFNAEEVAVKGNYEELIVVMFGDQGPVEEEESGLDEGGDCDLDCGGCPGCNQSVPCINDEVPALETDPTKSILINNN